MNAARSLWTMTNAQRARALREGLPIDARKLAGSNYRGVSLGLPRLLERLTWTTFRKSFQLDPDGRVSGYNVRLEQDGIDAPPRPKQRGGMDWTFGPFAISAAPASGTPFACPQGALFDYGMRHPRTHPIGRTRDIVVAMDDACDLLLGALYIDIAGMEFRTPSYFTLEREPSS